MQKNYWLKLLKFLTICLLLVDWCQAQSNRDLSDSKSLYDTIAHVDSVLFNAYNNHDAEKIKTFFTQDLEFYHDRDGLVTYEQVTNGFKNVFEKNSDIRRELVKGSLEVYPLKDYGAIEIGAHRFCHTENEKEDCGTFKFVMVWKKKDGEWKISRVISYGH
ncbi:MAG: nuclear transport factor 2 family protein [Parafilimonas sp.]